MNKTYKVRATRTGALQVVSELTSSVAAIGTKTVVAVATTMVAGAAIAAIPAAPTGGEGNVINDKAITWDLVEADANQNFVYNAASTQDSGDDFLTATEKKAFGKTMWVVAEEGKYATGIYAVGTGVTATNTGTIYVQGKVDADGSASSWQLHGMGAGNGATAVNVGTIEVENAYGMYVGNSDSTANETKPTIINNGTIRVYKQGVGMELGGVTKSTAENNGTIEVVSAEEVNKETWAHGVLIKDQAKATFTNTGTITATAANTSAIEIQTDKMSVEATVNLEGSSAIDGLIKISSKDTSNVATVELNAKGVTDTFKLKADANSNVTLNILDGANVTLEDGQDSTIDVAKITNGTLTASIFQEDNAFKTVYLEEQGVFNIKELNSKTTTDNDRLLLAYDSTYNLNGGRLAVAGQTYTGDIRVGTNPSTVTPTNKGKGMLNVSAGSYTFADMSVRDQGEVNVTGGKLSVADLDVVRGGKVIVNGGTLGVSGDLTLANKDGLTLQSGKLVTKGANVFTQAPDGKTWGASTVWGKVTKSGGVLEITDSITDLTLEQISKAQELIDNSNMVQVSFVNATIKAGQELTGGNVGGLYLENETGTATDGSFSVSSSADTVLAAVDFGGKEPTATPGAVKIQTNDGALVLSGNDGNVFSGLNANTKTVDVTGSLVLGNDAEATGTVNVETLQVDDLTVVGTFTANNVTVDTTGTTGTVEVDAGAAFTVNSLSGGTTKVSGTLDVTEVKADTNVQAENGGTVVLTKVAGTVGTPSSSFRVLSLTPEVATGFKLYGTNKNARDIIANSFLTDDDVSGKEVLYLDRVMEVTGTGQVNVGAASGTDGSITVGATGIVVIDANALGSTPLITGNLNLDSATNGYLLNLNKTGNFEIASGTVANTVTLTDDNFFISATMGTLEGARDNKVYIKATFDKNAVGDQSDADMVALANAIESGMNANAKNGLVFKAIGDAYGTTVEDQSVLTADGQWAASEYVAAPVVAGTYNVAYDAAAEVTRAVMNHNVKGEGMGAWADVFYASNEAKKIYGGQGYSADVYGGVFGFDTVFSCGAKLGAALTIGQADADGERSFSKYSNDADFWGLSVYTGKNVADTSLYIGADLSYLWVDNDLKGTVAGASADESLDSTVFTVGLRADWTAYEGAFNVVPHAGVRYTAIDVDDYRGYASDSINVVELPVGVEVNGTFEASGWKVVPSVDFTIVPQVGDKDVKTAVGNVDVIDNLYNTTVGVEAVYGQYAFGLDAGYGFGSDDRQNATVKANFSYRF